MPDPAPKGQSAAEVLADDRWPFSAPLIVAALLAQTPDGQPVVLMPNGSLSEWPEMVVRTADGALMALEHYGWQHRQFPHEHPPAGADGSCECQPYPLARLVPIPEDPEPTEGES